MLFYKKHVERFEWVVEACCHINVFNAWRVFQLGPTQSCKFCFVLDEITWIFCFGPHSETKQPCEIFRSKFRSIAVKIYEEKKKKKTECVEPSSQKQEKTKSLVEKKKKKTRKEGEKEGVYLVLGGWIVVTVDLY